MSAAEKIEHEQEHEGAANNTDFFDKNFEQGGLLPLIGRIGSLALGVVAQAPIDAVRGRGDAAHAKPHDAAHDPHKKEHDKKDEAAKEGEAGPAKKEDGHGHGDAQEHVGDLWAFGKSLYDVVKEAGEGKADQHTLEHAVSHGLDAMNLGWARPFAGLLGLGAAKGVSKLFKIREHKLEAIDPKYDTLGAQILGLPKDKKHGYHHVREQLCYGMRPAGSLEEMFDCFTNKDHFNNSLKTDPGKEEMKAQIARIIGPTKNPNSANIKNRIKRIMDIMDIEAKPDEKGHLHSHPHKMEDEEAMATAEVLGKVLCHISDWTDDAVIKQLYHGEKAASLNYDEFGDILSEQVDPTDPKSKIKFLSAFKIGPFNEKFKKILNLERVKTLAGSEKGNDELKTSIATLFDIEPNSTLDADGVDEEYNEVFGPKGTLGVGDDYEKEPLNVVKTQYVALKGAFDKVKNNLKEEKDKEGKCVDLIYAQGMEIKYNEFGNEMDKMNSAKSISFLRGYNSAKFGKTFRFLMDAAACDEAIGTEPGRQGALAQLQNLFALGPGPVTSSMLETYIGQQLSHFDETTAKKFGQEGKLAALKEDFGKVRTTLLGGTTEDLKDAAAKRLKLLLNGPEKKTIYDDFVGAMVANKDQVLKEFDDGGLVFEFKFSYLIKATFPDTASEKEKEDAKIQVEKFFGKKVGEEDAESKLASLKKALGGIKEEKNSRGLNAEKLFEVLALVETNIKEKIKNIYAPKKP
jgi:hypothetical protein